MSCAGQTDRGVGRAAAAQQGNGESRGSQHSAGKDEGKAGAGGAAEEKAEGPGGDKQAERRAFCKAVQRVETAADVKGGVARAGAQHGGQRGQGKGGQNQQAAAGRPGVTASQPVGQQAQGHLQSKGTEVVKQKEQRGVAAGANNAQKQKSAGKIDGAVRQRINAEPQALHKIAPFPCFQFRRERGRFVPQRGLFFFLQHCPESQRAGRCENRRAW